MVARALSLQDTAPTLDVGTVVDDTRRMVIARLGHRIRRINADPDDVVQDALVRLVEAQRTPRSRWDPTRSASVIGYASGVGRCGALNSLRTYGRWDRDILMAEPPELPDPTHEEGSNTDAAMARILAVLDLPEEKVMARHLAHGLTLPEIVDAMGITTNEASELRTRVRSLLLVLRED